LHDRVQDCSLSPDQKECIDNVVNPDGLNLDRSPVLHGLEDASQSTVDEIQICERLFGSVELLASTQTHWF